MMAVGEIIIDYDHDKKVGALGFGALLPNQSEASHNFAMSGSPTQVADLPVRAPWCWRREHDTVLMLSVGVGRWRSTECKAYSTVTPPHCRL